MGDIKVQRNIADIPVGGGTQAPGTPFGSLASAFVLNINNRHNHGGDFDAPSSSREADDMSGTIELTGTNQITFTRQSGSVAIDMRFAWESWEYTGSGGGANEFIVRSRNTITLSSVESATEALDTTPTDIDRCIPFITGLKTTQTVDDANAITGIAWLSGTNTLNVKRGGGSTGTTVVQVVTVEFTGSNWQIAHGRVAGAGAATGTITLRDAADGTTVGGGDILNWATAIIFHQTKADADLANDAIADTSAAYRPGAGTTTVDWAFHANHATAEEDHFVHILRHADMVVTRFTDTGSLAGANNVNITSAGLTDLTESACMISATSSGSGTAYTRGWKNGRLTSLTNFEHWVSSSGNTIDAAIQIIDLIGIVAGFTTFTKTYITDALLKKFDVPKTYTLDSIIKAIGVSKAYTLDTFLELLSIQKTYTLDTFLKVLGLSKTYAADVFLKAIDVTKTYSTDALIKLNNIIKTYTIDTILSLVSTKTYTLDSLFKKLGVTATYLLDALLKKLDITKIYAIDILLKASPLKTYLTDALFEKSNIAKTYLIDSLFKLLNKQKSYVIDSFIKKLSVIRTYTSDVIFEAPSDVFTVNTGARLNLSKGHRAVFRAWRTGSQQNYYAFYIDDTTNELYQEYSTNGSAWDNTRSQVFAATVDSFDHVVYDEGTQLRLFVVAHRGADVVIRRGTITDAAVDITWDTVASTGAAPTDLLAGRHDVAIIKTANNRLVMAYTSDVDGVNADFRQVKVIGSTDLTAAPTWAADTAPWTPVDNANNNAKDGVWASLDAFSGGTGDRFAIGFRTPVETSTTAYSLSTAVPEWNGTAFSNTAKANLASVSSTTVGPCIIVDEADFLHVATSYDGGTPFGSIIHHKATTVRDDDISGASWVEVGSFRPATLSVALDTTNAKLYAFYDNFAGTEDFYHSSTSTGTISWGDETTITLAQNVTDLSLMRELRLGSLHVLGAYGTTVFYNEVSVVGPTQKTYTSDVLFEMLGVVKTYTADVLFKKLGIVKTYTSDTLFKVLDLTKTYTSDTLFNKLNLDKTYTSDIFLKKLNLAKTYITDIILSGVASRILTEVGDFLQIEGAVPGDGYILTEGVSGEVSFTKTYTSDALFKKLGIIKAYTSDILFEKLVIIVTYTSDAIFEKLGVVRTYTSDTLFKKFGVIKAYTSDALFEKLGLIKIYTSDTIFKKLGSIKTYTSDTFFKKLGVIKTYTSDTLFEKLGLIKTYTSNVLFEKIGVLKTYTSDTLFKKLGVIKTYDSDVLLKRLGILKTYTLDTLFEALSILKVYTSDVLIKKLDVVKTYTLDTILTAVGIVLKTYTVDAPLKGFGIIKTYVSDTLIKKLDISITYASDTLIKKFGILGTWTTDVLLKGLGIQKTYTSDTLLKRLGLTRTYLIDGLLKVIGRTRTFAVDAFLSKLSQPKNYQIDTLYKKSDISLLYLIDSFLSRTSISTTYFTDSLFKKIGVIKNYITDTLIKSQDIPISYTMDIILQAGLIPTITAEKTIILIGHHDDEFNIVRRNV